MLNPATVKKLQEIAKVNTLGVDAPGYKEAKSIYVKLGEEAFDKGYYKEFVATYDKFLAELKE